MTDRLVRLSVVVAGLWLVLPLVPLAIWSVARGWRFPQLWPQEATLQPWTFALSPASGVPAAMGTSLTIALCATALSLAMGIPAGLALARARFAGRAVVEALMIAPLVVPALAVALGLHEVLLRVGLTNGLAGVVVVHLIPCLPYVTLVMTGIFAGLDPAHAAQARTLGATRAQALRHVTLPMVLPGVVVAGLFAFLVSWGQYALTLLVGGGRVETLPLLLAAAIGAGRHDMVGVIAMVTVLPGALVLLVSARILTRRPMAVA
jgi:putative spermidine/putrescine transport system permease protein